MKIKDHIDYWRKSAEHDLEAAQSMLESGKNDWCLFVGHLALEKMLKAIFVSAHRNEIPPKIHNLIRLAELSQIELSREQKFQFDKINDFHIQTRYPDYKLEFYKKCTKDFTEKNFALIKELYQWLDSHIE